MRSTARRFAFALLLYVAVLPSAFPQQPGKQILKTALNTCYEVDPDFLPIIRQTVLNLRSQIQTQRKDKLIAYISVPLTARGGGYRPLNVAISDFLKAKLEAKFEGRVWALAPGKAESELPQVGSKSAQGGEYMYMWTQVLAGDDGYGRDFDLLYAAGPSEIGSFFGAPDDLANALNRYMELRAAGDADFRSQIATNPDARKRFLSYYLTKASVTFSDGSHDEWNIFNEINRKRRANQNFGLGDQIPVFFDGRGVSPSDIETRVSPGYEKTCPN